MLLTKNNKIDINCNGKEESFSFDENKYFLHVTDFFAAIIIRHYKSKSLITHMKILSTAHRSS